MHEEYSFEKLKDVRKRCSENSNRLFTTIGLIVDCSSPHRKDARKDYCMRIKIIDQSSNADPAVIFLFGKDLAEFPTDVKVGDVLFIHKYNFEIWADALQGKKPYAIPSSFFRFFNGDPNIDTYSAIDHQVGLDDGEGKILFALNQLRKFSKTYFKSNSVPVYSKNSNKSSDFDLILKVTGSSLSQNENYYKIILSSPTLNFELNHYKNIPAGVYKVRSIADAKLHDKTCHLQGNDYTYFLEVSSWMKSYDPKEWDKFTIGKDNEKRIQRATISTKVLNENKKSPRKLISLKELISRDKHDEEVRVKVEFIDVFTDFEKGLKRFDDENSVEREYQISAGKYIYSLHFAVSDGSIEGQIFNIYLYTYDDRGIQFMADLDPKNIYGTNTLNFQQKYEHLVDRLLEETDYGTAPLEIVLSPMFNGQETIYRIVDTELLI